MCRSLFMSLLIFLASLSARADETLKRQTSLYGFIKVSGLYSNRGVESNGRPNLVAYNAAANPVLTSQPDHGVYSLQVQQSRLGLQEVWSPQLSALVEADFVDFNKSTPTVASQVRLRRAFIDYELNSSWKILVGQDWDAFSPLTPITYNYIGHYFLSGDLGFMRQQAKVFYTHGSQRWTFALGFPSYNNQSVVGPSEWSLTPSGVLSWEHLGSSHRWGASLIAGQVREPKSSRSLDPFGANLFYEFKKGDWHAETEAYWGQNLENLSLQSLAFSSNWKDLREIGAHATIKKKWDEWGFFTGFGLAKILNTGDVRPSYNYQNGVATSLLLSSSPQGYGILENQTWRIGFDRQLDNNLFVFTELAHLQTQHKLDPLDNAISGLRSTDVIEVGLKVDL